MSRPRWPALGAIGLAVSTLTEHAIGAIATVMILVVPARWSTTGRSWRRPGRTCPLIGGSPSTPCCAPVDTSTLLRGLLSFAAYTLIFGAFAWARFTSADVTS